MQYTTENHLFVICAYKENPHLEETVRSLLNQTVIGRIRISTSTPNEYIRNLALKYDLPLWINPISAGSGSDWNFAYNEAQADFVTLVHQDDIYEPTFLEETLNEINRHKDFILIYSKYYEWRETGVTTDSQFLRIKHFMNSVISAIPSSKILRRFVLGLGNPICCPAVTYNKNKIGCINFRTDYQNSHDWEAYARLAKLSGKYIYIPQNLVGHRVYTDSQTTRSIANGVRIREDIEILNSIWPKPIAWLIMLFYKKSLANNG
ncbi:glycosyltransferase family A protein [Oscillospiraceae bacterium 50-16]